MLLSLAPPRDPRRAARSSGCPAPCHPLGPCDTVVLNGWVLVLFLRVPWGAGARHLCCCYISYPCYVPRTSNPSSFQHRHLSHPSCGAEIRKELSCTTERQSVNQGLCLISALTRTGPASTLARVATVGIRSGPAVGLGAPAPHWRLAELLLAPCHAGLPTEQQGPSAEVCLPLLSSWKRHTSVWL